jgi:hypothetical protein
MEVLHVNGSEPHMDDTFIFEALWYGRSSFVVDSRDRAESLLTRFSELLRERRSTRARIRQTVHIVWDMHEPMPEDLLKSFMTLAKSTGLSIIEA